MLRGSVLILAFCFAVASCNAQQTGTPEVPAAPEVPITKAEAQTEEGTDVATDFEGLCRITRGEHIDAPTSGNRSTSSSNGTTITVIGSKSQSLSSVNGKAVVTVSGAAMLHLTFPNGEIVSVETRPDIDRIEIAIDGPDAITCKSAI